MQRHKVYCKNCCNLLQLKFVNLNFACVHKVKAVRDVLGKIVDVQGVASAAVRNKYFNCKNKAVFAKRSVREIKNWMRCDAAKKEKASAKKRSTKR